MEYGHEITTTGGEKYFFVEGCTYCSMSTGGVHESNCPYKPSPRFDSTIFYEGELNEPQLR